MKSKTQALRARRTGRSDETDSSREESLTPSSHETFGPVEQERFPLFQPDTLLADTYLATVRPKAHLEPEKGLMLAVLEDALLCFQKNVFMRTRKEKSLFEEVESWIMEEEGDWIFSFEMICETFEIDPRYLRKGLLDWKSRALADRLKGLREHRKTGT